MGEAQISVHTLHSYVRDPMGTIVGTAHLAKGQSRDRAEFETTSVASGEYSKLIFNERLTYAGFCLEWEGSDLMVEVDVFSSNSDSLEEKTIDNLALLLETVRHKIDIIQGDNSHFRSREARFKETSESTFERTFWLGLGKFIVLISSSK